MKQNKKTVMVTGANKGVGLYVCKRLLDLGFSVFGLSRSTDNLEKINSKLFNFYKLDICEVKEIQNVLSKITKHHDIDVLINNAAIFESSQLASQSISSIEKIIDTNIKGTILISKLIIPQMLSNNSGKIINISSVSGIHGIENQAVYSATKHALTGFAESLNYEIIPKGVQMINLCPGGINTSLWNSNNPYAGDVTKLLVPKDICDVIEFIINSENRVIFKNIVMFPSNEIH